MSETARIIGAIKSETAKRSESCLEDCRELVKRVEAGEFDTVFIVAFSPDGSYSTVISPAIDVLKKVGILERLKHTYLAAET